MLAITLSGIFMNKRYVIFLIIIILVLNCFSFISNAFAITDKDIEDYLDGKLYLDKNEIDNYLKQRFGYKKYKELRQTAFNIMAAHINNYPYFKSVRWSSNSNGITAYCEVYISRLEIDLAKKTKKPVSIGASECMLTIELDKNFYCKGILINIRKGTDSKLWPLVSGTNGYRGAIRSIFNGTCDLGALIWLFAQY